MKDLGIKGKCLIPVYWQKMVKTGKTIFTMAQYIVKSVNTLAMLRYDLSELLQGKLN